jgi:hypothetical protein
MPRFPMAPLNSHSETAPIGGARRPGNQKSHGTATDRPQTGHRPAQGRTRPDSVAVPTGLSLNGGEELAITIRAGNPGSQSTLAIVGEKTIFLAPPAASDLRTAVTGFDGTTGDETQWQFKLVTPYLVEISK